MARPSRKAPAKRPPRKGKAKAATRPAPLPSWLQPVEHDPAYVWAIRAWDRAAAVPNAWFDAGKADRVVELWPTVFRLTDLRFAGVPFRLLLWQEIIVRLLVGWKVPAEVIDPATGQPVIVWVRLFRTLRLWIPRKNGKSEFLAGLALLFWALEATVGGQGYVFARDETQAELPFKRMKAMIALSAELAAEIQPHRKSLYLKPARASFELLTGAEEGKHGKSPVVIVGDEMHEWRSRTIENDLRQGTAAQLEPIELYASTAGLKSNLVGVELWDESRAVLEGTVEDPTTLVVLFAADEDDDWNDEAVWAKANPSLGLSPTLAYLRREANLAKGNPRKTATFKCYHLNQWVESVARWLPATKWNACASDKLAWQRFGRELKGRRCFGGFDVSSTQDITALIWLFPPEGSGEKWQLVSRFWVPESTLEQRIAANPRVPFRAWVDSGALETTPGDYVDQGFVEKAILEGFELYQVANIGYDSWNAGKLVGDLQKDHGVDAERLTIVRQGIHSLGEPSKQFERLVFAGQLDHGGHPVLKWMAGNAVIRFDENLNFMPAKKRSAEKIDGITAAVTGLAVALAVEDDTPAASPWDNETFSMVAQ
jgi:phage terminase large subunit-like protein